MAEPGDGALEPPADGALEPPDDGAPEQRGDGGVWSRLRRLAQAEEGLACLLSDAMGRTHGMDPSVAPMWSGARCTGPAFTVRPIGGDLGAVFDAIDLAVAGDVLVIEGVLGPAVALWGEHTSRSAGSGETQVPIVVGGVAVRPGDAVIGDENGVTAVPVGRLAEALAALPAVLERDRAVQAALVEGGTIGALRREGDRR